MEAELRAVSLGLVAAVNDPVEQSWVSVVLEQHLNSLPAKNLNLDSRREWSFCFNIITCNPI